MRAPPADPSFVRANLLGQPGCVPEFPFGPEAEVFKVKGKMFALMPVSAPSGDVRAPSVTLKCDPDQAIALRARYPAITPGYHMSKRHWNTIVIDGTVPADEMLWMLEQSYALVFKTLRKAEREALLAE
ncbi:MAG: putative DNA-binding protein (MmcQ/YjbR family) [Bradymonadia bacterium]|jgi:predicted DNA-binding protein (MmcQ/YjbR family)